MKRLMGMIVLVAMVALVGAHRAGAADTRQEVHFPSLPGSVTIVCDLHMHTVFSDGNVWPTVRVDEAWREGIDAIALTDHIEYQPHKADLPTQHNRPADIAADTARVHDVLLVRGAEITRSTPPGHFNAIFLEDVDPLETDDFYDVFAAAAEQGAFVFWNHPGWQGRERGQWGEQQTNLFARKQLHGIEVCNGNSYYEDAHGWAVERKMTLIGTSDIHDPSIHTDWTAEDHRTLTLVFAEERTLDSVREALFAGRTAVWQQNKLLGYEGLLAEYFPRCIQVFPVHYRHDQHAWFKIANLCPLDLKLERTGEVGPKTLDLPALATSLIHVTVTADQLAAGLNYRVTNFITAPKQSLEVTLTVEDHTPKTPAKNAESK
jgi:predicted metal-dependent phosphoesterase TrpH